MCDGEPPAVYERHERKARKDHVCDDCRLPVIKCGDTYVVHEGLWDGRWDRIKACRFCSLVREGLSWNCCEPCLGELWVDLSDAGVVEWVPTG